MKNILFYKNSTAIFIALLFHICGAIGILLSDHKEWFISSTPLLLLLMAALLILTHQHKSKSFFLFVLITYVTGMAAEIIGVNTKILFGNYFYSNVLGTKILEVPFLIGINWFIVIYCAGTLTYHFEQWMMNRMGAGMQISPGVQFFSFIFDAAFLTTLYDWILEPVAQKLGFWQWLPNKHVPFYNYICWFALSAALLTVLRKLNINSHNPFALNLFIIQLLFFFTLRIFL